MSLYNEAGRRRTRLSVIAVVVGLLLGAAIGFAIGRSSAGDPTASDVVANLRTELEPIRGGLELLPTEYAQFTEGDGVERAAVDGDLDRIRAGLRAATFDLRVLAPDGLKHLEQAVGALETAVDDRAPTSQVEQLVGDAEDALAALPGG